MSRRFLIILVTGLLVGGFPVTSSGGEKSAARAIGLSLLLPGAGELYLGFRISGSILVSADAAFWLGYSGYSLYGSWLNEDARAYAASHAGVDQARIGDDEDFYKSVGDYMSMDDYNFSVQLSGGGEQEYSVFKGEYWAWDTEDNQDEYRLLRNDRQLAVRRAQIAGAGLVLTRIVSVLNVYRLIRASRKNMPSPVSLLTCRLKNGGFCVAWSAPF